MTYQYGNTILHDGANLFLVSKKMQVPAIKPTSAKIARIEGAKKTGDQWDDSKITIMIVVRGSSRIDLENRIDTLMQGLSLRQQRLFLHSNDNRYWVADALDAIYELAAGKIVQTTVQVDFLTYSPFALAGAASNFSLASQALSAVSGQAGWYTFGLFNVTGGGNVYARPTFTITNTTPTNNNVLGASLTSGSPTTSITIAAPGLAASVAIGDKFILNDGAGHTQTITASATAAQGATTLTVTSFSPNFSYPLTTTSVDLDTSLTGLSIFQNNDGQILNFTNISGWTNGLSLVVNSDPTIASGWTGILNNGSPLPFNGIFPGLQPVSTNWEVRVQANSVSRISASATLQWTSRWLS